MCFRFMTDGIDSGERVAFLHPLIWFNLITHIVYLFQFYTIRVFFVGVCILVSDFTEPLGADG